jgi:hypothetical protein
VEIRLRGAEAGADGGRRRVAHNDGAAPPWGRPGFAGVYAARAAAAESLNGARATVGSDAHAGECPLASNPPLLPSLPPPLPAAPPSLTHAHTPQRSLQPPPHEQPRPQQPRAKRKSTSHAPRHRLHDGRSAVLSFRRGLVGRSDGAPSRLPLALNRLCRQCAPISVRASRSSTLLPSAISR